MKQRVLLKGRELADLLHRISTVNVSRLQAGQSTPALILNPQGKIISFFQLTRLNDEDFEVQYEDTFLSVLDQFTFAERYEIEALSIPHSPEASESDRILAMTPRVGFEFKEDGQTNPLEINLSTLIHENKGCYPGQEVIEKIISLGSPPRKLGLLKITSGNPHAPTRLIDDQGAEAGTLTSASDSHALAILKRTHQKPGLMLRSDNAVFTLVKVQE